MSEMSPAEEFFFAALDRTSPADRAAYLDEACAGRPELRARVEKLLAAHPRIGGFLDSGESGEAAAIPESGEAAVTVKFQPDAEAGLAVVVGRYKLLQQIGQGGMGTVWMADQTAPVRRRVAIKLIRVDRGQSRTILSRFEAERQAIALMDHPHIAKLLDAGTADDGSPYFVMELVKGVPLTDYCDARKLGIPERLTIFLQICSAVQHAHQKGVIHRDLKPSNILVESHDGKPVPKVIDFGLAKAATGLQLTDHTLFTAFGSVIGTPLYMAPEQADFNAVDVDTRADVYALGVILYELLTGTTPLTRETIKKAGLDEMLKLIREQDAPTPSSRLTTAAAASCAAANRQTEPAKLGRLVKGELDWIVLKALAKERDRRYETANGFARDVERFLAHEPVTAGPPGAAYRLQKFVRRNRPQVVAAGLILLALVAGIAGTTSGFVQARSAARREADLRVVAELKEREADAERTRAVTAAEAEMVARNKAERRLVQIDRGVELLAGMLKGINPYSEEKDGPTIYQLLRERAEKAADQLDQEAVGDRLTVARLQTILGSTLRELGSAGKAVEVLERSLAVWEREPGDHPNALENMSELATTYLSVGRTSEVVRLCERVRDSRIAGHGPDHQKTLESLNNLAVAYHSAGRPLEAVGLLERVRDAHMLAHGPSHTSTLTSLNNLGVAYRVAGRTAESVAILEGVRDARLALHGPTYPSTLMAQYNLARSYRAIGRTDDAVKLLERVRDVCMTKYGADHIGTLTTQGELAATYLAVGRPVDSLALYSKVAGMLEERQFQLRNAREILAGTISAFEMEGRLAEAEAWRRKWSAAVKQRTGLRSVEYAHELSELGGNLIQQRKWVEAESVLRESLEIGTAVAPDIWTTFNTRSMLGGALKGQTRYTDAEPLLLKGYEGLKARENKIPHVSQTAFQIPEALDRLVELYVATGKSDEEKKWRSERAKYPTQKEVAPPPREKK
ncbi:MAG: serine/threonine-protein kinase [Gemmataceae bacterium]